MKKQNKELDIQARMRGEASQKKQGLSQVLKEESRDGDTHLNKRGGMISGLGTEGMCLEP